MYCFCVCLLCKLPFQSSSIVIIEHLFDRKSGQGAQLVILIGAQWPLSNWIECYMLYDRKMLYWFHWLMTDA